MTQDPVAVQFFRLLPQTLFHQQQLILAILFLTMLVVMVIGFGVPLWLALRLPEANPEPVRARRRTWKLAAFVIMAVVVLNCIIAVIALRPALSKSPRLGGTGPRSDCT